MTDHKDLIAEAERLAKHYDDRVAMHTNLVNSAAGRLRSERGKETAEIHRATATALRDMSAKIQAEQAISEAAESELTAAYMAGHKAAQTDRDNAVREECARIAYRICAETHHVTLGDKIESAIRASKDGK